MTNNELILTQEEIDNFKVQLAEMPEAIEAINLIEQNGGNLELTIEQMLLDNIDLTAE